MKFTNFLTKTWTVFLKVIELYIDFSLASCKIIAGVLVEQHCKGMVNITAH